MNKKLLQSNRDDKVGEAVSGYSLYPLAVIWPAHISGGPFFYSDYDVHSQ